MGCCIELYSLLSPVLRTLLPTDDLRRNTHSTDVRLNQSIPNIGRETLLVPHERSGDKKRYALARPCLFWVQTAVSRPRCPLQQTCDWKCVLFDCKITTRLASNYGGASTANVPIEQIYSRQA